MNFKKIFLFACLIICLSGAAIYASDVNGADSDSDFNESHFQCCSFAIQEKDETVFAFRQDAEFSDDGVLIHNDKLNNQEIIVQEIEAPDSHFIHAMITEDGWIASRGGDSSNDTETQDIENIAREMLSSKKMGDNVTFEFWDNGYLYIKGTGPTYDYDWDFILVEGKQYSTIHNVIVINKSHRTCHVIEVHVCSSIAASEC